MPTSKPRCLPFPEAAPVLFQPDAQCIQDVFWEACQLGCGPWAERRQWPGVLGGLNQVCCKFRWSGTKWPLSAQFKMIGLALPCSNPFCSMTDFKTTRSSCGPLHVNLPDVFSEKKDIFIESLYFSFSSQSSSRSIEKIRVGCFYHTPYTYPRL